MVLFLKFIKLSNRFYWFWLKLSWLDFQGLMISMIQTRQSKKKIKRYFQSLKWVFNSNRWDFPQNTLNQSVRSLFIIPQVHSLQKNDSWYGRLVKWWGLSIMHEPNHVIRFLVNFDGKTLLNLFFLLKPINDNNFSDLSSMSYLEHHVWFIPFWPHLKRLLLSRNSPQKVFQIET